MNFKLKAHVLLLACRKFRSLSTALYFVAWICSIPVAFFVVCILYPALCFSVKANSFWGMVKSTIGEGYLRLVCNAERLYELPND
jgi:hypothetical protein